RRRNHALHGQSPSIPRTPRRPHPRLARCQRLDLRPATTARLMMHRTLAWLLLPAHLAAGSVSDPSASAAPPPTTLPPLVVTASRSARPADTLPDAITVFSADDLRASPSFALDDALRAAPAFSLFRRSGSLTAHPTAQGVSLRGLGPSGASRSLVL